MSLRLPQTAAASSTAAASIYDEADDYDQFSLEYMRYVEPYRRIQRAAQRAIERTRVMHTAYAREADYVTASALEAFRRAYERFTGEKFASADAAMEERAREFMVGRFEGGVNRDNIEQFAEWVRERIETGGVEGDDPALLSRRGELLHELRFLSALDAAARYDNAKMFKYGQLVRARANVHETIDTVVRRRQLLDNSTAIWARALADDPTLTSLIGVFSSPDLDLGDDTPENAEAGTMDAIDSRAGNLFETASTDDAAKYARLFAALAESSYVKSISIGPVYRSGTRVGRDNAARLLYTRLVWNRSIDRIRFRNADSVKYALSRLLIRRRDAESFGRRLRTMRQLTTLRFDGPIMRFYDEQLDKSVRVLVANAPGLRYLTIAYAGVESTAALIDVLEQRAAPISELQLTNFRRANEVRNMRYNFLGYNGEGEQQFYALLKALGNSPTLRRLRLNLSVDKMPADRFISALANIATARSIREVSVHIELDLQQQPLRAQRNADAFSRMFDASASDWVRDNKHKFGDLFRAIQRNEDLMQFDMHLVATRRNGPLLLARVYNEFDRAVAQRVLAPRADAATRRNVNELARMAYRKAVERRAERWTLANVNPVMRRMVELRERRDDEAKIAYEQYAYYLEDEENEEPIGDDDDDDDNLNIEAAQQLPLDDY